MAFASSCWNRRRASSLSRASRCRPPAEYELLQTLAHELGELPNDVLIEGHTDSKPYGSDAILQQLGIIDRPGQLGAKADGGRRIAS